VEGEGSKIFPVVGKGGGRESSRKWLSAGGGELKGRRDAKSERGREMFNFRGGEKRKQDEKREFYWCYG